MAAGAAHAQQVQRQGCEEEEQMTPYDSRNLAEDWEFKILRSLSGEFRKPERLAQILEQEAKAGWILVEKFDNQRVRLKRRAEARKFDRQLDFDAYRSYVGATKTNVAILVVAMVFAAVLAVALLSLLA
jgi:hypothetical protein